MKEILVKDKVEVNINGFDINLVEKKIFETTRDLGARLLRDSIRRIEEYELSKLERSCLCGGRLKNIGRVRRKITTTVGQVQYARTRFKCCSCGKERYPLDEALGLQGNGNVTLGLKEKTLYLATDTAYDKAADNLKKLTGIELSGRQIQNWAKEEGEKVQESVRRKREQIFDDNCVPESEEKRKRVFVQVDGTFVKDRSKPRSVECKVGVIYSEKAKVSKNRYRILDKRTYATVDNIDSFREEFIAECTGWGVWDAEEILYVADGASWIKKMCKYDFPGAVYLLDFWHLAQNISRALGEDHKRAADNWIAEVKTTSNARLLLKRIRSLYVRIRDPDLQERLRKLYGYVKSNEEGIENWKKVKCLGASGAIEKAVDITVARRFKKRGMSWIRPGLSSLLSLRLLKLNGEWDKYWAARGVPV